MVSNLSTDNLRQGFDLIFCLSEEWAISAPPYLGSSGLSAGMTRFIGQYDAC